MECGVVGAVVTLSGDLRDVRHGGFRFLYAFRGLSSRAMRRQPVVQLGAAQQSAVRGRGHLQNAIESALALRCARRASSSRCRAARTYGSLVPKPQDLPGIVEMQAAARPCTPAQRRCSRRASSSLSMLCSRALCIEQCQWGAMEMGVRQCEWTGDVMDGAGMVADVASWTGVTEQVQESGETWVESRGPAVAALRRALWPPERWRSPRTQSTHS